MLKIGKHFTGTTASGMKVFVPEISNYDGAAVWLEPLELKDQADILYMTERFSLRFLRQNVSHKLKIATDLASVFLYQKLNEKDFVDILLSMKLFSSIDRIRYGKNLLTAVYVD